MAALPVPCTARSVGCVGMASDDLASGAVVFTMEPAHRLKSWTSEVCQSPPAFTGVITRYWTPGSEHLCTQLVSGIQSKLAWTMRITMQHSAQRSNTCALEV